MCALEDCSQGEDVHTCTVQVYRWFLSHDPEADAGRGGSVVEL